MSTDIMFTICTIAWLLSGAFAGWAQLMELDLRGAFGYREDFPGPHHILFFGIIGAVAGPALWAAVGRWRI